MLERIATRARRSNLRNIRYLIADAAGFQLEPDSIDRASMVIMLGEIPDRQTALAVVYQALKPSGILSITESLPDPQYQSQSTVSHLAQSAGFIHQRTYGNHWAFTMNFTKPEVDSVEIRC